MSENKLPKMRQEQLVHRALFYLQESKVLRFTTVGEGAKVPILIKEDNSCQILPPKDMMTRIKNIMGSKYESFTGQYSNPDICLITAATAKTILETAEIASQLETQAPVKSFAFLSDPSLTFARIPFDPSLEEQPTPCWDKFLTNFTNTLAVRMWIGSLFFADSDRSQYLWFYGQGGNGKSTLARIIATILGPFVRFEQAPPKDDKYWTSGLIGKRLIVLDDCNHYGFVKTGLFKSLTGSSKVRVEQKFCAPYDADLACKFLFTSNEMPMVSAEIADQRRLIFSSALNKHSFEFNANFHIELESELGAFVSNCMLLYQENCGDGRPIPSDQTEALELGGCYNEEIAAWLETNFEEEPACQVSVTDFRKALSDTKLSDRRVYAYLKDKGIERHSKRLPDGKFIKVIKGLRQKVFGIMTH